MTNSTVAFALACTLLCTTALAQQKGTFTDTRDGKIYKTVKIGEQVWLAENLNYEADGSKCYDNKPANCKKYGRLYNWQTAKEVCPKGWYLPSKSDWKVLTEAIGGEMTEGRYLKANRGWNESGNGKDKYGFSALPGGFGNYGGSFEDVGDYGSWWCSSVDGNLNAHIRYIGYDSNDANWDSSGYDYLNSVRCLQDTNPKEPLNDKSHLE